MKYSCAKINSPPKYFILAQTEFYIGLNHALVLGVNKAILAKLLSLV